METLISDCLPPIFKYLSITDLLNVRQVSRRFKQEIDDFLPKVRSLPLYLTIPQIPEKIANYEKYIQSLIQPRNVDFSDELNSTWCFRRVPFGSSGSGTFEDGTILQHQNRFWSANFVIVQSSRVLWKFLPFIQKLCPNIDKLALVIDNTEHYKQEIVKILEAFPAIKVLLLENTLYDMFRRVSKKVNVSAEVANCPPIDQFRVLQQAYGFLLPPKVIESISAMTNLNELYLCPRRHSTLFVRWSAESNQQAIVTLLTRLRVFHINTCEPTEEFSIIFDPKNRFGFSNFDLPDGPLEELACGEHSSEWLIRTDRLVLPHLKKLIFIREGWFKRLQKKAEEMGTKIENLRLLPRPELKVLDVFDSFTPADDSMKLLNSFTGLESFHFQSLWGAGDPQDHLGYYEPIDEELEQNLRDQFNDVENVPENLKNRTIKHVQMIFSRGNDRVRGLSKYFVALDTCVALEPEYSVVRLSDLRE